MSKQTLKYIKRFFILILVFISAIASGQDNPVEKNAAFNPENVIIDVRTLQEFESGHLKNAINIPYNKIAEDIKDFVPDKEKTIVIYCQSGRRSDIAEKTIKDLGYKNVINAGRYSELKELEDSSD